MFSSFMDGKSKYGIVMVFKDEWKNEHLKNQVKYVHMITHI